MTLKKAIDQTGGTVEVVPMSYLGIPYGNISKLTGGQIGIDGMPIWDEGYRDILTGKIVDRYWNREIGFETIDLFMMKMRVRLNEIMPFYNQLYQSTQIPYDALSTVNMKTHGESESTNTDKTDANTTNTGSNKNASRSVTSTTPQTMLSGDEDYASAASDVNSAQTSESLNASKAETDSESAGKSDTLVTGYQGAAADLIMRYRDSLINIDVMVMQDLEPVFMQIFDNGDSYTQRGYGYGYY